MKRKRLSRILLAIVSLAVAVLACGPDPTPGSPSITITSPVSGTAVTVGQETQIISIAVADAGVARVELLVNGQVIRTDMPPDGNPTTFSVAQPWTPTAEGTMAVSAVVYDLAGAASQPAAVTLNVQAGSAEVTSTPAPSPTPVPDVEGEGGCTLNASYVADVTIPDDTVLSPGTNFVKTWRLRNSGSCDWGSGFTLVFVSGEQMGGAGSVPVPATAAGSTVDANVNLVAPGAPGTYRGNWRIRSDEGVSFGTTVFVQIIVPAPATETPVSTDTPPPTETPTVAPTEETSAAPSDLMMTVLPSGYVSFVWVDNSDGEDGFHILADGAIHANLGANIEGYGFQTGDHFCDETVEITVVAYRGSQTSDPSNAVSYTGPACPPPVVVEASGIIMAIPSYLDLDTGALGDYDADVDFLWQSSGGYRLIGMNGMRFANMGVGPNLPSFSSCMSAYPYSESAVYVPTLQAGTRLCFETTAGNFASLRVQEIQSDNDLVISYVTWEGP